MPSITRPNTQALSRWDDAVPTGSILSVGTGEAAVLVFGGKELAVLREGEFVLSAETLPVLARAIEGTDVEAEIWFVGGEHLDRPFACVVPVPNDGLGHPTQVTANGHLRCRVASPERAVLACIGEGPEALSTSIQNALEPAIATVVVSIPLRAMVDGPVLEAASMMADAFGPALATLGIEVLGVSALTLALDNRTRDAVNQVAVDRSRPAFRAKGEGNPG